MTTPGTHVVHGSCHHDCPDTCMWEVTVEHGRAVRLRGSADHPTTRGELCPKVNRFLQRVHHPERLRTPLRRRGPKGHGDFVPISWDEAIATIADRFSDLHRDPGPSSILQFSFDGTQGVIQKGILADRFFDALGASDIRRDLCGVTAWLGAADVNGTPYSMDPEDLAHSRFIILWGTNTLLTNRHLWPTIERAREAGATVVTIDPLPTATAQRSDVFIQIRPGADVALVLAMVHVMDRDELLDTAWLTTHTTGWHELRAEARTMPPSRAATITGIDEERIEWLATSYATERPAAIRTLVGPEHRLAGREIMRAIAMLPALTGAWRDVGGGLTRSTQAYFETALRYPDDRPIRRSFNMAELGRVLGDDTLAPPIRALFVHNSNPAVILPDQNAVVAGLEREDLFTVVAEQFLTDTARYADVVLPATTQIEHLDLGIAWGHLYLSLNEPAISPLGEALPNTEIFRRLAARMGLDDPGLQTDDETLIRELLDSDHPWLDGITYQRLRDEHWVRLAVKQGHRPNVDLAPDTPDGRLRLGAVRFTGGIEVPGGDPSLHERFPLLLMSPKQHTRFLNANYGGFDAHLPDPPTPTCRIHPVDASARSIVDGEPVRVHNDRGSLTVTAEISAELLPGTVAVPFGWWHRHTPENRGANALTNPAVPDAGVGSAAFLETLVEVTPARPPAVGQSHGETDRG